MNNLGDVENLFDDFHWPEALLKVIRLNLIDYEYWYLMTADQIFRRREGLLKRYPKRNLIPFAKRDDNDDIACFVIEFGDRVFIVHDFASEGYEQRQEYDSFWSWFNGAISEMINSEE